MIFILLAFFIITITTLILLGGSMMVTILSARVAHHSITFLLQDNPQQVQAKAQEAQRIATLLAEIEKVQHDLQKIIASNTK